jgi:hypothetical protein
LLRDGNISVAASFLPHQQPRTLSIYTATYAETQHFGQLDTFDFWCFHFSIGIITISI